MRDRQMIGLCLSVSTCMQHAIYICKSENNLIVLFSTLHLVWGNVSLLFATVLWQESTGFWWFSWFHFSFSCRNTGITNAHCHAQLHMTSGNSNSNPQLVYQKPILQSHLSYQWIFPRWYSRTFVFKMCTTLSCQSNFA